jgi:tetratricopeptide (TPR) repeat protein
VITKCPRCDTESARDSKFCSECAAPLPSSTGPAPALAETLEIPKGELRTGAVFAGRYRIIEVLGKGGMGEVYRALDTKLNEEVALKLIKPEIASDGKILERFSQELRIARKIVHKNVGRMYELMEDDRAHFITMELVSGQDLRGLIRQSGQLAPGTAVSIAKQVCEGMSEAHRLGVVHRDLKPANIMIDREGQARIMDFGIARSLKGKGLTGEGVVIGTPEYMSPEQVDGKEADPRSDIYSLGIILYEMVTGRAPFEGDSPFSVAYKHRHEAPAEPRKFNPQLPDALNRVILRCLEKDREARYQTAQEMLADLEKIEGGAPASADRASAARKALAAKEITVTFSLRKRLVPALIALAVMAIGAASFFIFRKSGPGLDPDLVAVAVFENQTGDASLDSWGRMASDVISWGLSQIGGLKVVPTMSVPQLSLMAKPGEKTSPALSPLQALAEETGAGKVVSGTYYLAGKGEIQFLSSITDTQKRKLILSLEPVKGSLAEKGDVIEKLRQRIMGALAANPKFSLGDWKGMRPPSYEAYQEFGLGMNLFGRNDLDKAIGHLEKAVELDPGFMPAYQWLARIYSNMRLWDKAVSILGFMDQNRDKLTPEGALFLDRMKAQSQGKNEEALRALVQLQKLAPREALYTFSVAIESISINKPRQALDLFEKVEVPESWLNIGGSGISWFGNWCNAYYLLGNHKKELEVVRRARKYFPDALILMGIEARALAARGKLEEVKKVVNESLLSRSSIGTAGRVMLAAARELRLRGYQEAFKDTAGRAVEWYRGRAGGKQPTEQQRSELAAALYVSEQWEEAGALIEKLRSEKPDNLDYVGYGGALAARRGDKEEALRISEELKGIDRPFTFGAQTYWRARIAALLGMKEEAVELLRQSFSQGNWYISTYGVFIIQAADLDPLRDFAPFRELMKPKG